MAKTDERTAPARDVVVIGASAGGVNALRTIASRLPRDFPAAADVLVELVGQRLAYQIGALRSLVEEA